MQLLKSKDWGLLTLKELVWISVWMVLTVSSEHGDGTPPRVVNVAVNNDILTWELQSDFTGKIYHYRLLVYKDGQERGDGKSLETENDYYDLSTLNLSPGDYDIEVQAVTPSGPGPYSEPLSYSVEGNNDSSSLVTVVAVTSTLLVGLILGSALFATMIWRLRWRSQPDPLGDEASLPFTVRNKELETSLNMAYSTGSHSLENSTTLLFPQVASRRGDSTVLINERIYESIESLDELAASPPYVPDSDINMPDPDANDDLAASPPYVPDSDINMPDPGALDDLAASPPHVPDSDINMPDPDALDDLAASPSHIPDSDVPDPDLIPHEAQEVEEQLEYLTVLPSDDQTSATARTTHNTTDDC